MTMMKWVIHIQTHSQNDNSMRKATITATNLLIVVHVEVCMVEVVEVCMVEVAVEVTTFVVVAMETAAAEAVGEHAEDDHEHLMD